MNTITIIGLIAGLLTTFAFLPQIIKTIKTKDVKSISLIMYCIYIIGCGFWFYYAFLIDEIAIVITNIFSTSFGLIMLFLKLKYRNNKLNHFALFAESKRMNNIEYEVLEQALKTSAKDKSTLPNRL